MKFIISCILLFLCQRLAETSSIEFSAPEADDPIINESAKFSESCDPGSWVPGSGGEFPKGTLPIGFYRGRKTYAARVEFKGELLPGKLYRGAAYAITDTKYELPFYHYETLCGDDDQFIWVPAHEGDLPSSAVLAGSTVDGRPLYLCRVNMNGADIASGLVSENMCYVGIDFNYAEPKADFEVLSERSY